MTPAEMSAALTSLGYTVTPPALPIASKLAGLTADRWASVARRVTVAGQDQWLWSLSVADRNALHMAVEAGRVVKATKRVDGVVRLLARRAG